ncbi:MAG: hypothetical protein ACI93T_000698 [Porticoccaceae bacterium]|jgi:hypothetical protein
MTNEAIPEDAELLVEALAGVQVTTWLSRESWDILVTNRRSIFIRRSKGIGRTIAITATLGPSLGHVFGAFTSGGTPNAKEKEIKESEIEAFRQDAVDFFETPRPQFPDCRVKNPFLSPTQITLGDKIWKFRFTYKQYKRFVAIRDSILSESGD